MKNRYNSIKLMDILLILFILLNYINSQNQTFNAVEECKKKGERFGVREFSECEKESDYVNNYICCYYNGKNGTSNQEGCIALDYEIFVNKTVSYKVNDDISFNIICDTNYNFAYYYKNSFIFIFCIFITFLI